VIWDVENERTLFALQLPRGWTELTLKILRKFESILSAPFDELTKWCTISIHAEASKAFLRQSPLSRVSSRF
jgi:hypothetical protein